MIDLFNRSWELTKLSLSVVRQDKEMLLFPLLASIFSFFYTVALFVPSLITMILFPEERGAVGWVLEAGATFLVYWGLAFIATFFNVCVVYTSKVRFEGGDATFFESIRFGFKRIPQIFGWALVAGSVGLFLKGLDMLAQRAGGIAKVLINILRALIGTAWAVATIFVVPAIVYEGVGPLDAIKHSKDTVMKTWGESLMRHYGLGLIQFLVSLPGILVLVLGFMAGNVFDSIAPLAVLLALGASWCIVVGLIFNVLNAVYNTALYSYARTGQIASGYDPEVMQGAFRQRTATTGWAR